MMSNSNTSYTSNPAKQCQHKEFPADLLKFSAYTTLASSFEDACEIIKKKKLVLGEPAVVPFKYTHSDGTTSIELVFGIGSVEIENPYLKCSITNDILNEGIISGTDEDGNPTYKKLIDILDELISKEEADKLISNKVEEEIKKGDAINKIITEVLTSDKLSDGINNTLNERLSWKSLDLKIKELGIE